MAEAYASDSKEAQKAWRLMEKIGVCMLVTRVDRRLRARPMGAYVRHDDGCVCFLTDVNGVTDDEMRAEPEVCLAFADRGSQTFVSLSGKGEVVNDRALITIALERGIQSVVGQRRRPAHPRAQDHA